MLIIFKCGRERGCNFRGAVSVCELRLSVNIAEGSMETFLKTQVFYSISLKTYFSLSFQK